MKKIITIASLLVLVLILIIFLGYKKDISSYIEHDTYYEYKNVSYGNHKRNILDLTLPKTKTNGLILYIHGGSWLTGSKDGYFNYLIMWCEERGFAACAINYRYTLSSYSYKDILKDIDNALKKVKELGEEKYLDLTKVLLTGHSAGGHLSLLYSYFMKDTAPITPSCVVNLSGPTDLTDPNYYKGKQNITISFIFSLLTKHLITYNNSERKSDILLDASPITFIDNQTVPTITAHGVKDSVVPFSNATILHEKLEANNIENILIPFPNSDHGLESDPDCQNELDAIMFEYAIKYLK